MFYSIVTGIPRTKFKNGLGKKLEVIPEKNSGFTTEYYS